MDILESVGEGIATVIGWLLAMIVIVILWVIQNAFWATILTGLWHIIMMIFSGGAYEGNFWMNAQTVFWVLMVIDFLHSIWKVSEKSW